MTVWPSFSIAFAQVAEVQDEAAFALRVDDLELERRSPTSSPVSPTWPPLSP